MSFAKDIYYQLSKQVNVLGTMVTLGEYYVITYFVVVDVNNTKYPWIQVRKPMIPAFMHNGIKVLVNIVFVVVTFFKIK